MCAVSIDSKALAESLGNKWGCEKMSMIQSDHEKQWKCLDLRGACHITRALVGVGGAFEIESGEFFMFGEKRVRYEALLKHFSLIAQFLVFAGKFRSVFNWINDKCRRCITKGLPKKSDSHSQSHQLAKKENLVWLFVLVEAKFTDINECFDSEKID